MNHRVEMPLSLSLPTAPDGLLCHVCRAPLAMVSVAVLALFGFYWETVASMVAIWSRSETFTHGFLILPISLFLVWQRRGELARYTPAPDLRSLPLLVVLGVLWLLAHYASVLEIEQMAMIAMVPVVVWAILGRQVTCALQLQLL